MDLLYWMLAIVAIVLICGLVIAFIGVMLILALKAYSILFRLIGFHGISDRIDMLSHKLDKVIDKALF